MYNKVTFILDAKTLLQDIYKLSASFCSEIESMRCIIFKAHSSLYWAIRGYISANKRELDVLKIIIDLYDIIDDFLHKDKLADAVAKKLWETFDCAIKTEVESRLTCYIFLGGAIKPSVDECIKYVIDHIRDVNKGCCHVS